MTRYTATSAPAPSLWAGAESAIRLTLRTLSAPSSEAAPLEQLEGEQSRIRRMARHWLIG